jgi:hypothetical protein
MPLRGTQPAPAWGTRPANPRCRHDDLVLAIDPETGRYYARCRRCLLAGPKRPSGEAARKALLVLGARG